MPRTVYRPGPNEPPKDYSERELRDTAERHHLRNQFRLFDAPFKVFHPATTNLPPDTNDVDRTVRWEALKDNTLIIKSLAQTTAEDCRYFCFKDCAFYMVTRGDPNPS